MGGGDGEGEGPWFLRECWQARLHMRVPTCSCGCACVVGVCNAPRAVWCACAQERGASDARAPPSGCRARPLN
jgi:hypothetical protein